MNDEVDKMTIEDAVQVALSVVCPKRTMDECGGDFTKDFIRHLHCMGVDLVPEENFIKAKDQPKE